MIVFPPGQLWTLIQLFFCGLYGALYYGVPNFRNYYFKSFPRVPEIVFDLFFLYMMVFSLACVFLAVVLGVAL